MKPLPPGIGMVQCEIERNQSGFNKFWPKYTLSLTSNRVELLNCKKQANSKTPHYKINLSNSENKYKQKGEEEYIGRLRATFNNQEFYIFDKNPKASDIKPGSGEVPRRQLGTILYPSDKMGDKAPRKLEVYLPLIEEDETPKSYVSWLDNEFKKSNIFFEYS